MTTQHEPAMGYPLHGNNNDTDYTWTYLFMLSAHVLQSTWCAGLGIKAGVTSLKN